MIVYIRNGLAIVETVSPTMGYNSKQQTRSEMYGSQNMANVDLPPPLMLCPKYSRPVTVRISLTCCAGALVVCLVLFRRPLCVGMVAAASIDSKAEYPWCDIWHRQCSLRMRCRLMLCVLSIGWISINTRTILLPLSDGKFVVLHVPLFSYSLSMSKDYGSGLRQTSQSQAFNDGWETRERDGAGPSGRSGAEGRTGGGGSAILGGLCGALAAHSHVVGDDMGSAVQRGGDGGSLGCHMSNRRMETVVGVEHGGSESHGAISLIQQQSGVAGIGGGGGGHGFVAPWGSHGGVPRWRCQSDGTVMGRVVNNTNPWAQMTAEAGVRGEGGRGGGVGDHWQGGLATADHGREAVPAAFCGGTFARPTNSYGGRGHDNTCRSENEGTGGRITDSRSGVEAAGATRECQETRSNGGRFASYDIGSTT